MKAKLDALDPGRLDDEELAEAGARVTALARRIIGQHIAGIHREITDADVAALEQPHRWIVQLLDVANEMLVAEVNRRAAVEAESGLADLERFLDGGGDGACV